MAEQTSSHFDHSTTEYSVTVLLKGGGGGGGGSFD